MERLPEFLASKRRNAAAYRELLQGIPGLGWQQETAGAESSWWLFSLLIDSGLYKEDRDALAARLRAAGIQVRPLFMPLPLQPAYEKYGFRRCGVAESLYQRGLSLPSATSLGEDDVRVVCSLIKGGQDLR